MDIHEVPPSSAQPDHLHVGSPKANLLQSPPSTETQPQAHNNSKVTPSSTPLVAEPSLATIHEDGTPSTNNSLADDTDFLPPTGTHGLLSDDQNDKVDDDTNNNFLSASWMNPSMMASGPFDKRKSSPAILGLPFGITDDPQLDLHLSQHRNSIEAAVLLASFNRGSTVSKDSVSTKDDLIKVPTHQRQQHQPQHWRDDLSIAVNTHEKATDQDVVSLRRHSYDIDMTWDSMPPGFKERTDLFNSSSGNNNGSAFKPVSKHHYTITNHIDSKEGDFNKSRITWTQDGFYQATTSSSPSSTGSFPSRSSANTLTPISPYPPRLLHPHAYATDQHHPTNLHQRHDSPLLHPLARQPSANEDDSPPGARVKKEFASHEHGPYFQYGEQGHPLPQRPHFYLPHDQHQKQRPYYYPDSQQHHSQMLPPNTPHPSFNGKLPLPPSNDRMPSGGPSSAHPYNHLAPYNHSHLQQHGHPHHPSPLLPGTSNHLPPPPSLSPEQYAAYQERMAAANAAAFSFRPNVTTPSTRPKRKRMPKETEQVVEAGDANFPDMCPRDVELAKTDPQARPRRQKLRFEGDLYTPNWVRYNGQAKEGLCDTCQPGRWLQLKNSAYWYHKQFYHGISSVSGSEFVPPAETRWVDQDLVEGLCHQCRQWVAVSNVKRKNSVLWFRHAHKCHLYNKPKNGAI